MTKFEQDLYNKYLKTIAHAAGRPYTIRKDFSDFENDPKYLKIKKLASYFYKNPHVNVDLYLEAPYRLYTLDEGKSYTLDFYISLKAQAAYKRYLKWLELKSPDLDANINFLKESIIFISKFCIEHNLTFEEYMSFALGLTPAWMTHYFERKISIYILLEYPKISDMIYSMESTHRKMVLGDLDVTYPMLKQNYLKSTLASKIVKRGIEIINNNKK